MNIGVFIGAMVILVIGLLLFIRSIVLKKKLDNSSDVFEGVLTQYVRSGKRLYPIIEFIHNGTEKTIKQGGVTNMKLIKQGQTVRILEVAEGKFLTDYFVKLNRYYAISFVLAFILVLIASFVCK